MSSDKEVWELLSEAEGSESSYVSTITATEVGDKSPEVQLEYYENQLMGYLVQDFEKYRSQVNRLQSDYFRNENFVLYSMFKKVQMERGLSIDIDYLKVYLQSHASEIALDNDRIQFDSYASEGSTAIEGLLVSVVEVFQTYKNPSFIKEPSFEDAFTRFKTVYTRLGLVDALQTTSIALTNPIRFNRKSYFGVEGSLDFIGQKVNALKSSLGVEQSFKLVCASDLDFESEDQKKPTLLTDLKYLPTLNEAIKGIRTNTFAMFVAPEKGMKSKFATRVSHEILLNGFNICFWGKEGGSSKVMAELRAIHFDHYYNIERGQNYEKISGSDLLYGTLDPSVAELEKISRMDLVRNANYGKIFLPDYPFELEYVETVVREAAEEQGCKFVVIDYAQAMTSKVIIDKKTMLEHLAPKLESLKGLLDICIWCPAQMATDAVQELGKGIHRELRNITADSKELTKSADLNLMLYTNDALSARSLAKMYLLPSRNAGEMAPIDVFTDKVANNVVEMKDQTVEIKNGEVVILNKGDIDV
jgi:replicative DNA helicase